MKEGQAVNFYQPAEKSRKDAVLIEIEDAGPSLNKIITLEFKDGDTTVHVTGVKHFADAERGEAFWMIKGAERAPRGWAGDEEEVAEVVSEDVPVDLPVEDDVTVEEKAPRRRR